MFDFFLSKINPYAQRSFIKKLFSSNVKKHFRKSAVSSSYNIWIPPFLSIVIISTELANKAELPVLDSFQQLHEFSFLCEDKNVLNLIITLHFLSAKVNHSYSRIIVK